MYHVIQTAIWYHTPLVTRKQYVHMQLLEVFMLWFGSWIDNTTLVWLSPFIKVLNVFMVVSSFVSQLCNRNVWWKTVLKRGEAKGDLLRILIVLHLFAHWKSDRSRRVKTAGSYIQCALDTPGQLLHKVAMIVRSQQQERAEDRGFYTLWWLDEYLVGSTMTIFRV